MLSVVWLLAFLFVLVSLAYRRASLAQATLVLGALLLAYTLWGADGALWKPFLWLIFAPLALLNVPALRLSFVSKRFLVVYRRMLPAMSDTEREALEAGTVWWDGDLFSGRPNWRKLLSYPKATVDATGPVETTFLSSRSRSIDRTPAS